tara:strand:+ start:2087 stop:4093 length:2007 start_codon:yes stop_codon:yes gene_type:complete
MSNAALKLLAGAGATADPVYVDDIFSCFLYEGNATSRSIVNGIDLADKGGLVWTKNRDGTNDHNLVDSARGLTNSPYIRTNSTNAQGTDGNGLTAFNSNGYTIGTSASWNANGGSHVSWTFAKQEKFFDIVTWSGTDGGGDKTISHSLGCKPAVMMIRELNGTSNFSFYHKDLFGGEIDGTGTGMYLSSTAGAFSMNNEVKSVSNTDFTVGTTHNGHSSYSYIAYLFAHDEQEFGENSDEAIMKVGKYSGNSAGSATTDQTITLGFEPQWILIKKSSGGIGSWSIFDNMRGVMSDGADRELRANHEIVEQTTDENLRFEADGFTLEGSNLNYTDGSTAHEYIYMAIARPHKPASKFAATDVFKPQVLSAGEGSDTFISTGFPVDAVLYTKRTSNATNVLGTRLTGGTKTGGDLKTDSADAEGTNSGAFFLDHSDGVTVDFSGGHFNVAPAATDTDYARYYFRRMRGFFDIVTYTSNTTYPNTFAHNLGVVPELVIVKRRDGSQNWTIYAAPSGNAKHFYLNSTAAEAASSFWNSTTPTASVVTVGGQDEVWGYNGYDYVALLFASASGISKVGSYSGTGSSQNIDCGFSNGARFVLIKNKNNAGGWYFWDSERGITAGNDPFLRLGANDGDQNYTGDDIDPHSSGFNVSSNNNAVNKSGRDYLFLAIA